MALALGTLAGCGSGSSDGHGTAQVTIWGEEYIEQGIPADVFADGWAVRFDEFLLLLSDIHARSSNAEQSRRFDRPQLVDLVNPGPHDVASFELRAQAWPEFGYSIRPADSDDVFHQAVSDAQRERMLGAGYSVYISGRATRGDETKTFAWGFATTTQYDECVSVANGRQVPGFVVSAGGTQAVQITIHGDHFFYDDLASEAAVPRFDALAAADADGDGDVTLDELSAVKLVRIAEGTYGTGSVSDVDDLGAFVRAQTASIGHFQGEGHCRTSGS
jgi:hypothetical protein